MRTPTKRYEVTLKIRVKCKAQARTVQYRAIALFHWGTIADSLVDGLDLTDWPTLVSVQVKERIRRKCEDSTMSQPPSEV